MKNSNDPTNTVGNAHWKKKFKKKKKKTIVRELENIVF